MPKQLHFVDKKTIRFEDVTHWAELKIKKNVSGQEYADILVGWKDDPKWHAHFGIRVDQSLEFERYRGIVNSMIREVESAKQGSTTSSTKIIDHNVKLTRPLILRFSIDVAKGEVSITQFGLK